MSTVKMTFTIPDETYTTLISLVPKSKRSKFISISIEEELTKLRRKDAFKKARRLLKTADYPMWKTPAKTSAWLKKERASFNRKLS